MKLQTTLLGKTYQFRDIKDVLAKANEEKTGDKLAGLAAENARERVAAKVVLSALTLADLRENPAVPYESDEVTRIIQDDLNCAHCASKIESKIAQTEGYRSVSFNFATKKLRFETDKPNPKDEIQAICDSIEDGVTVKETASKEKKEQK